METLKTCVDCGLEATTKESLELFVKEPRHPHGRGNLCKKCQLQRYYYKTTPLKKDAPYLRKCTLCGLEGNNESELELFVKDKRSRHGRQNRCKACSYSLSRKGGKYFAHISEYKKRRQEIINKRRIRFKDRRINFPFEVRSNVCSKCGKKYPEELTDRTHLHHEKYDEAHPLNHTIELCKSCHHKLHGRPKND